MMISFYQMVTATPFAVREHGIALTAREEIAD